MTSSINADNFWRQQMETDRALRRHSLQKLVKELEIPGKRQGALQTAERWFGVTSAEDVRALLDAMPQPRTSTKRRKRGRRPWVVLEEEDAEWTGHSVQRQDAAPY